MTEQKQSVRRRLKQVVGRAELIDFPDAALVNVPAKIDTGAFRSSVWATNIHIKDDVLFFTLLGPSSEYYSGKECHTKVFEVVEVENSFGHKENRYSVHLSVRMGTKRVKSNFTLADRTKKIYPVLVGRKLLRGRYLVDVAEGQPLDDEETVEVA